MKHLPLPLFAAVMGLCGLAMVWRALDAHWAYAYAVSAGAAWTAAGLMILLLAGYGWKALRHRDTVMAELRNPVRVNFLPAISIDLILLGILFRAWTPRLAFALWTVGVVLHLILTVAVVSTWLQGGKDIATLNPAWFIPAVGNVLVPIAAVPAGYVETAWLFIAMGLFFWIALGTLVFYRLIFAPPLAPVMRPTLVVLLSPPAVGFLAWMELNGAAGFPGRLLFYTAVATFLLLLPQIPAFLRLSFAPSWWAYTFPLAAFCVAVHRFAVETGAFPPWAALALGIPVTAVILAVLGATLHALARGRLLVPETAH